MSSAEEQSEMMPKEQGFLMLSTNNQRIRKFH